MILLMAAAIVVLITGNWNRWIGEHASQETDDAYLRADLTPLSTKAAGVVAAVAVSDYQAVNAGDLLVQLRDDDFRAQVQQAEAAALSGKDALIQNLRQKELQDSRIVQADAGIHATEAEIAAAEAGVAAAKSAIANAQSGIDAAKADAERTELERRRQEALFATESATRQTLEQAVANPRPAEGCLSGESEIPQRQRKRPPNADAGRQVSGNCRLARFLSKEESRIYPNSLILLVGTLFASTKTLPNKSAQR
jgi:membrane fusion protein (multidrug efflux system)